MGKKSKAAPSASGMAGSGLAAAPRNGTSNGTTNGSKANGSNRRPREAKNEAGPETITLPNGDKVDRCWFWNPCCQLHSAASERWPSSISHQHAACMICTADATAPSASRLHVPIRSSKSVMTRGLVAIVFRVPHAALMTRHSMHPQIPVAPPPGIDAGMYQQALAYLKANPEVAMQTQEQVMSTRRPETAACVASGGGCQEYVKVTASGCSRVYMRRCGGWAIR
jgi:hypothetical protein